MSDASNTSVHVMYDGTNSVMPGFHFSAWNVLFRFMASGPSKTAVESHATTRSDLLAWIQASRVGIEMNFMSCAARTNTMDSSGLLLCPILRSRELFI